MARKRVADVLVDTLVAAGVKRVYGLVGDSLNGVTDSMRPRKDLQWVPVRHEETAAFAAGAEAHLTGQLTVCAGSCGPGNLHLINGLYDCHRSRVPVLAIAAQIPSAEIGSGYFQETHPEHLFAQCSHYCELISQPEQMPRVLEIAMQTAIARRGVSVIALPGDIALRNAVEQEPRLHFPPPKPTVCPADDEIEALAKVLNGSAKITILAGAGCAGAHAELIALAGKLNAPIVHALRGKEFIEYDNPFDVGMTGLARIFLRLLRDDELQRFADDRHRFPVSAVLSEARDRYPDRHSRRTTGPSHEARLRIGRRYKATLQALLPKLKQNADDKHLKVSLEHYRKARKALDELATEGSERKGSHPQFVARQISELANDEAIFTCDVGTPTIWASRYLKMNGKRRLLGSFVHGSMASALPQAIGAQLAMPDRQVISMSGDGGVSMLLGDLLTLRQLNLPVKVVVFRNDSLAFVEMEMKASGFLDFGVELQNPDFAALAQAAGLLGLKAETAQDVRPMLQQAFKHDGPALVEVLVHRQELSMPPTITLEQATGFGVFMLKAVLSGRGDEIVDLAKVNLFR